MAAEIKTFKFGTPEFPVPVRCQGSGDGVKVSWLASEEDAIFIPTMRDETAEQVYGRLIRKVVTDPSMMDCMYEMLIRLDKNRTPAQSKSYSYTIMGAPGTGKTYLAKQIGELVHPRGAFVIACNAIETEKDFFQETVTEGINQARKREKLDAHIQFCNETPNASMSREAVAKLKISFGNDIVTEEKRKVPVKDENGKVIDEVEKNILSVDWRAITKGTAFIEMVVDKVMEIENIPYERDDSALPAKVNNGPLLKALLDPDSPDYGRIVIRDEVNRLPTIDALLQVNAFFSEPESGAELQVKGADERTFTIKRDEIPATFMFLGNGNQAEEDMGLSAQKMTKPMLSRDGVNVDITSVSDPTREDYISRTLKHLTGVPAYYIYMLDKEHYDRNPQELSETLMFFRTVGLSKEEKKKIPQEEIFNIKHIDRVIKVAQSYASLFYETDKMIKKVAYDDSLMLPEKYLDHIKETALVDLRYVYKIYQHSKIDKPRGSNKGAGLLKSVGRGKAQTAEEAQYDMNRRIAQREKRHLLHRGNKLDLEVGEKMRQMIIPADIDAKLAESENPKEDFAKITGLWESIEKVAKGLNFEFAGYVGEDSVASQYNARPEELPNVALDEIKSILVPSIQEEYRTQGLKAEDAYDDEALLAALQMLTKESTDDKVFVPNYDFETSYDQPFKAVYTSKTREEDIELERTDLVKTNQFADSFIIKNMRVHNMEKLAKELPDFASHDRYKNSGDEVSRAIALGQHPTFFTTILMVNNEVKDADGNVDEAKSNIGLACVIYNKKNQKTTILSNFDISDDDHRRLSKSDVTFVNYESAVSRGDYDLVNQNLGGRPALTSEEKQRGKTLGEDEVLNSHIIASLLLRVDPEMAAGGEGDADTESLCTWLVDCGNDLLDKEAMKANDGQFKLDAVRMTNIEFQGNEQKSEAIKKYLKTQSLGR